MSIKKSSLQQAFLEAQEIKNGAYENAKKTLEESLTPKIKEIVDEALKDVNETSINEDVKLDVAPEADLNISVSNDGSSTVSVGTETEEQTDSIENLTPNTDMEKMETPEDEIFEVEGLNEEDNVESLEDNNTTEENPFETLNAKLDNILNKVSSIETAEQEELEAQADETETAEGEVEIIDDENISEPENLETPSETPEETSSETSEEIPSEELQQEMEMEETITNNAMEDEISECGDMEDMGDTRETEEMEEVVYEIEDDEVSNNIENDDVVYEIEELEDVVSDETIEEIEIVDEDMNEEGEEMEEMTGLSHSVQKRMPNRYHQNPDKHHAPVMPLMKEVKELKAHYESNLDELNKENKSLKETIKEYKESFIVLRKQINEVQTFNAKLAYANKLFTKGGLTNEEKITIAEEFDKVESVEEAKKLYNKLLSENKTSNNVKNSSIEKLKSVQPTAVHTSSTQTLYENKEIKRMKELAGILK